MMHFPSQLTEEEESLLQMYAKLKKKKKAMISKQREKIKVEKPETTAESVKRSAEAAADATEQAKKLLKSGAIRVSVEKKEQQTFKRKKQKESDPKSAVSFQPFSPGMSDKDEENSDNASSSKAKLKYGLYDSFVPSQTDEAGDEEDRRIRRDSREGGSRMGGGRGGRESRFPKRGNTVYVHGYGLTEPLMKSLFTRFGPILNISMETEKNCSFVTFESTESADQAVEEINGSLVSGIQLKVSIARHQPTIDPQPNSAPTATTSDSAVLTSASWASMATNASQKGAHRDQRELVQYTEDEDIF